MQILLDGQAKAARKLIKQLDSDDPDIVIKASKEILKGVLAVRHIHDGNIPVEIASLSESVRKELTPEKKERLLKEIGIIKE